MALSRSDLGHGPAGLHPSRLERGHTGFEEQDRQCPAEEREWQPFAGIEADCVVHARTKTEEYEILRPGKEKLGGCDRNNGGIITT